MKHPVNQPQEPGRTASRRRFARLAAVQALYQADLNREPEERVIAQFLRHRVGQDIEGVILNADVDFFTGLVRGVASNRADLERRVGEALSSGRDLDRMEVVLRAILEAGAYELCHLPEIPSKVVITEYVDIAGDFFSENEAGLANGVLDRIARTARGAQQENAQE